MKHQFNEGFILSENVKVAASSAEITQAAAEKEKDRWVICVYGDVMRNGGWSDLVMQVKVDLISA